MAVVGTGPRVVVDLDVHPRRHLAAGVSSSHRTSTRTRTRIRTLYKYRDDDVHRQLVKISWVIIGSACVCVRYLQKDLMMTSTSSQLTDS